MSRSELLERVKSLEATLAQTTVDALKEQRHLIATMASQCNNGTSAVHSSLFIKPASSSESSQAHATNLHGHQPDRCDSNNNLTMVYPTPIYVHTKLTFAMTPTPLIQPSDFVMNTSYLKALAGQYQVKFHFFLFSIISISFFKNGKMEYVILECIIENS